MHLPTSTEQLCIYTLLDHTMYKRTSATLNRQAQFHGSPCFLRSTYQVLITLITKFVITAHSTISFCRTTTFL